jgi:hypothetical protein
MSSFDPFTRSEVAPGAVGAFIDDMPPLTHAEIKPFVIAILLRRGGVAPYEVVAAMTPHCRQEDTKVGGWDPIDEDWTEGTLLEKMVDQVFGEMVAQGEIEYSTERNVWKPTPRSLGKVITWCSCMGAKIPAHLFMDLGLHEYR